MRTEFNVANLLIAKDIARAATAGDVIKQASDLSDGEIVVCSPANVVLEVGGTYDVADQDKIKFIQRSGDVLVGSDLIDVRGLTSYSIEVATAATQQLDYVGYNGTSGAITATDENNYYIRMRMLPSDTAGFTEQRIIPGVYTSDSSAVQSEIALGAASDLIANLSSQAEKVVQVEVLNGGASTAVTGSGTITYTEGSDTVTVATDIDAVMSVNDYIRFGTATTDHVYKITAMDTTNEVATLDRKYQGTSGTTVQGSYRYVAAATAEAAAFGVKIQGVASTKVPPKYRPFVARWETTIQNYGSTTITNTTASTVGVGQYAQILELEHQFQGNEGNEYRAMVPAPTYRTDSLSTESYDVMVIGYKDTLNTQLGQVADSYKQIYIALADTADPTAKQIEDATSGIVPVFEDWAITSWIVTGIDPQNANLTNS